MNLILNHIAEPVADEEIDLEKLLTSRLVVYNDDHNSFEHVIRTFMEILRHTPEQAEQCAWIIHNSGKCSVKEGSFDELKPYRSAITERGIDARIE